MTTTDLPASPAHTADPVPDMGDVVGRDVLVERCTLLEHALRARNDVSADEIDKAKPGGAHNPDPSAMGWLAYYAALNRWHVASGAAKPVTASQRWDAQGMDDMRAALAAEPITLTLDGGRKVGVYPKSEYALNRIAVCSLALEWLVARRVALMAEPTSPETLTALRHAADAEAMLTAEFVWIVTHAGPGVPWADDSQWEHGPPPWCRDDLTPFDIIAIRKAHLDVNLLRVNAIAERSRHLADGGGDAMPLAAFLGVMAADLQVKPEELARKWSLGEVFAASLAKWEASERAKRKATAERDAKAAAR